MESVLPEESGSAPARKPPTRRILFSVALALAIVIGDWFVAGQQGADSIGRGGVNQKLLPRAGEPAPDFTVTDILCKQVSLASLNRPVPDPYRRRLSDLQLLHEYFHWPRWNHRPRGALPGVDGRGGRLRARRDESVLIASGSLKRRRHAIVRRGDVTYTRARNPFDRARGTASAT